ncbi:hypothetical protein HDU99_006879, partial [Rhizoclosmatium hyalinum]
MPALTHSPFQQATMPQEVIQQIFCHIPPLKVLTLKRLCKRIHECLSDEHFALLNLRATVPREALARTE